MTGPIARNNAIRARCLGALVWTRADVGGPAAQRQDVRRPSEEISEEHRMRFWQIDGVSRGKLIIVLILLYCLMVANVLVPTIRLSLQPANYLLFGLSQLIPLFIIGVSARL